MHESTLFRTLMRLFSSPLPELRKKTAFNDACGFSCSKTDNQSDVKTNRVTRQKKFAKQSWPKDLSTYAHNVKIITKDEGITLNGPVKSEEEKQKIAELAAGLGHQRDHQALAFIAEQRARSLSPLALCSLTQKL